jgi:prepilin-type N-terminal cleavage/methylation domain-containing protein
VKKLNIKNNKLKLNSGFTLVELLIVIALIGVLAVALVATLNPIEQVNKARDARYKNDAAEVLAGIERYYATQLYYPWEDEVWGTDNGYGESEDLGLTSRMPGMGVCYAAAPGAGLVDDEVTGSCITTPDDVGELIKTDELKTSFANKEPFREDALFDDKLYLWREANTSGVYVCFIPKANSNRQVTTGLWDLGVPEDGVPTEKSQEDCDTQAEIDAVDWSDEASSFYICVPE